tara:strand:+ start:19477 stop:20235 length:759 start_codon:yes stop_codon:yes gene_type:complete
VKEFLDRFSFDRERSLFLGIERERFVTDDKGEIVPRAHEVLASLGECEEFGFELSACQIEDRIGPVLPKDVLGTLMRNDRALNRACSFLGLSVQFLEVAPPGMCLSVYPDPTGRYAEITKDMPREVLDAACRVTGTHIHVGMPDHESALRVYNGVVDHVDELRNVGDHSNGERHRLYQVVAPNFRPPKFKGWEEVHEKARADGWSEDLRSCWHYIRITGHGTIEFRVFGASGCPAEVATWAFTCKDLCAKYL